MINLSSNLCHYEMLCAHFKFLAAPCSNALSENKEKVNDVMCWLNEVRDSWGRFCWFAGSLVVDLQSKENLSWVCTGKRASERKVDSAEHGLSCLLCLLPSVVCWEFFFFFFSLWLSQLVQGLCGNLCVVCLCLMWFCLWGCFKPKIYEVCVS